MEEYIKNSRERTSVREAVSRKVSQMSKSKGVCHHQKIDIGFNIEPFILEAAQPIQLYLTPFLCRMRPGEVSYKRYAIDPNIVVQSEAGLSAVKQSTLVRRLLGKTLLDEHWPP